MSLHYDWSNSPSMGLRFGGERGPLYQAMGARSNVLVQLLIYGLGGPVFESRRKQEFYTFPTPPRPARSSPKPLFNGWQGLFYQRYNGRGVRLINLFHPLPSLRMRKVYTSTYPYTILTCIRTRFPQRF